MIVSVAFAVLCTLEIIHWFKKVRTRSTLFVDFKCIARDRYFLRHNKSPDTMFVTSAISSNIILKTFDV